MPTIGRDTELEFSEDGRTWKRAEAEPTGHALGYDFGPAIARALATPPDTSAGGAGCWDVMFDAMLELNRWRRADGWELALAELD